VKFAVGVPNVRGYADPRLLVDLAIRAEAAGWDGFFVWDHLVYHEPGDPVCDPWVVASAVAAVTQRLRFGVLLCALPRRRPWKVAREVATLDRLSGGRAAFGAGLGSLPAEEYAAFGEDDQAAVRAGKLEEGLAILRGLWSGEPFSYSGRHYIVFEIVFLPTPVQRPLPIWVGGRWPNRRAFRRAAFWDGVFPTHEEIGHAETMSPAQLAEIVEYTLKHRESHAPFDVLMEGHTDSRGTQRKHRIRPYADVGLTWWVEKLGWFRGSMEDACRRIDEGPPS
jgi:alkanesulfonate monooxygenase SsuD/methylene tetrahydromethanopterin reductase-like flavin-dependent oxidoreductase (luciferase family)